MIVNNRNAVFNSLSYFADRKRLPALLFYQLPGSGKNTSPDLFFLPQPAFCYSHITIILPNTVSKFSDVHLSAKNFFSHPSFNHYTKQPRAADNPMAVVKKHFYFFMGMMDKKIMNVRGEYLFY